MTLNSPLSTYTQYTLVEIIIERLPDVGPPSAEGADLHEQYLIWHFYKMTLKADDTNACTKLLDTALGKRYISRCVKSTTCYPKISRRDILSGKVVRLLAERGSKFEDDVETSVEGVFQGLADLIATSLSLGMNTEKVGKTLHPAILAAILKGHVEMVQYLLQVFHLENTS